MKDKEKFKKFLRGIKNRTKIVQVTVTRTVRTEGGDTSVSFTQELPKELSDGLTLKESRVTALVMAMQAEQASLEQAFAGGLMSKQEVLDKIHSSKAKYAMLIQEAFEYGEQNG